MNRVMCASVAVLVAVAGQAAGQTCMTSVVPEVYPAGASNTGLDAGDFNGDGAIDLVVLDQSTASINVLINTGSGVFTAPAHYAMSNASWGVAAGDVDGDGLDDVVTCAGALTIRRSSGTSFFPETISTPPVAGLTPIARDMDQDGDVDLLVTLYTAAVVYLANDGAGNFPSAVALPIGAGSQGISVGDVNGDELPDIVCCGSGSISVIMNLGGGAFAPFVSYQAPGSPVPYYVTLADFDGDRDLDLATANYFHVGTTSVTVYFNNGDGTYAGRVDYTSGFNAPVGIAAGDFDGDLDQDLAVGNFFSSRIDLLLNDGSGSFPTREAVNVGNSGGGHYMLVAGDFSGLGRDEFAAARWGAGVANGVVVWRGLCDGTNPISVFACPTGAASFDVRPLEPGATYVWEWFDGDVWTALTNGTLTRVDGSVEVAGADTPRLELQLDLAQGAPGGSYRCVMTDSAGTLVSAPGLLSTLSACPSIGDTNPRAIPVVMSDTYASPGSTAVYDYAGLVIEDGAYFEVGSGETLNLSDGRGTLWVGYGGVLSINGVVNGSIVNEGLVRLQITAQGLIANVRGGVIRLYPPVPPTIEDPVVPIPSPLPPVIPPETGVVIGPGGGGGGGAGGGGGGGGGSFTGGGGTYRFVTPEIRVEGQLSFDATAEVTGSFTQTQTGVLRMFIAGGDAGETYNQFLIGEQATIDGTIQIVLDPVMFGFTPSVGESFDMVIADGGITLAPGLQLKTMITAAGAEALGLSLPAYVSAFAMDPDELVEFPSSVFDMTLVNGGTTLRFTLNQAICAAQPLAATQPACGRDTAEFTVANPGSGPLTYQWQIEDNPLSETWHDVAAGFYDWLGTVQTPTGRSMTIRKPRYFASGTRFRCVVTGPCATVTTDPVALDVLDQTEEACGNCPICEADFDDNGGVDGGDLAAFFDQFEAGELCADVDRNGGVDGGDLAAFFLLFESGGCD